MFKPNYSITSRIMGALFSIEADNQTIAGLSITPKVLSHLRKSSQLQSIHYSTMIEGNRLTQKEVMRV
jgi:hypothetical protein